MDGYWTGSRVLITGGAGFIGSYLAEELLRHGAEVAVADCLVSGSLDNLTPIRDRIEFVEADLRDLGTARRAIAGRDIVLHLASLAFGVTYSHSHHGEMLAYNLMLNTSVLEACRLEGTARVLATSSSCVYPDDAVVPTPESQEVDGTLPESSNEGYGWSKRMLERQAAYYCREYGMSIAVARPFNAYGPRQPLHPQRCHVLPAIAMRILKGEAPLQVWGSGNQTRSFVHARDFARGLRLITELAPPAEPINLGHDRETRLRDLVDLIFDLTGRESAVVYDTSKPEGAARKGCNPARIQALTGWTPAVSLDQGLPEMLDYIRMHLRNLGELPA